MVRALDVLAAGFNGSFKQGKLTPKYAAQLARRAIRTVYMAKSEIEAMIEAQEAAALEE